MRCSYHAAAPTRLLNLRNLASTHLALPHIVLALPVQTHRTSPHHHSPYRRQVLNLRSCIKAAMDFVSPEHISHCLAHTEQFRQLPRGHRRQEDPLGTKVVMLHAVSHALSTLATAGAAPAAGWLSPGTALLSRPTTVPSTPPQQPRMITKPSPAGKRPRLEQAQ